MSRVRLRLYTMMFNIYGKCTVSTGLRLRCGSAVRAAYANLVCGRTASQRHATWGIEMLSRLIRLF